MLTRTTCSRRCIDFATLETPDKCTLAKTTIAIKMLSIMFTFISFIGTAMAAPALQAPNDHHRTSTSSVTVLSTRALSYTEPSHIHMPSLIHPSKLQLHHPRHRSLPLHHRPLPQHLSRPRPHSLPVGQRHHKLHRSPQHRCHTALHICQQSSRKHRGEVGHRAPEQHEGRVPVDIWTFWGEAGDGEMERG